jgi:Protein of unknown function (DUF1569)
MRSLFDPAARQAITDRLAALPPTAVHKWGKMDVAQMLAHCANALEVGTGDRPRKQAFIGKVLGPFVRASVLGDKPFSRNSPTDPTFVITDARDFACEMRRLLDLMARFCAGGASAAGGQMHSFLGKISGEEWGALMYKHIDHHLGQFGA